MIKERKYIGSTEIHRGAEIKNGETKVRDDGEVEDILRRGGWEK